MYKANRAGLLSASMLFGLGASVAVGMAAYAAEDEVEEVAPVEEVDDSEDRIVVTGSRIRRDTFTSTSPLQVINEDTIAESGVLDVGELLRTTTVVQGAQLDQTVNSN
ncbi:MAG: hypothetical protein PVI23_12700, partial [Maricaulaceae bacterium]